MHITKLAYIGVENKDELYDKLNNADIDYSIREIFNDGDEIAVECDEDMANVLYKAKIIRDYERKDLISNNVKTIFFY